MISTHMGYGFVFTYLLTLLVEKVIFPSNSSEIVAFSTILVLLGLLGGAFPDLDRLEQYGLSHRKTLHYPIGYGLLALTLIASNYFFDSIWIVGLSCFSSAAWLHSAMDILDGPFGEDMNKGVYEHIRKRWIRACNWFPFGSLREWVLQYLGSILVIPISPQLSGLYLIPGWIVATCSYLTVWVLSAVYEFRNIVPKRQEIERKALAALSSRAQS